MRLFLVFVLAAGLTLLLVWTVAAQEAQMKTDVQSALNVISVGHVAAPSNCQSSIRLGYTSDITFTPSFTTYLPAVFKGYGRCAIAPTLVSPLNGNNLSTIAPLFQWNNGNNPSATELRLQTATDSGFTHLVKTLSSGISGGIGQHRFSRNFSTSTTYYWRAYLMCGDTQGPYSEVWSFTTGSGGTILPPPTLIAPANGSTVPTTTVTLQWSTVNGAVEYLAHWRQVGEEGNYFAWVSNTRYTVSELSANITHEWWISARNDYAIGTDSETWQFTVPAGSSLSFQGLNSSFMLGKDERSITIEEHDSR